MQFLARQLTPFLADPISATIDTTTITVEGYMVAHMTTIDNPTVHITSGTLSVGFIGNWAFTAPVSGSKLQALKATYPTLKRALDNPVVSTLYILITARIDDVQCDTIIECPTKIPRPKQPNCVIIPPSQLQ